MKQVSNSDREKIIKHKLNNETEENIAKWLFISKSSVTRIWSVFRKTGSYLPQREGKCGRKPMVSAETMEKVIVKIEEQPDITLGELIEVFNLKISEPALCKRLKKLDYTLKKRLSIQRNRSDRTL